MGIMKGKVCVLTGGAGSLGLESARLLLKEGAKATLFIPSDLGYGPQGSGPIPPDSELIFYEELEKVQ